MRFAHSRFPELLPYMWAWIGLPLIMLLAPNFAAADQLSAPADTTIQATSMDIAPLVYARYRATGLLRADEMAMAPTMLGSGEYTPALNVQNLIVDRERRGTSSLDGSWEPPNEFLARCRESQEKAEALDRAAWPRPYVVDYVLPLNRIEPKPRLDRYDLGRPRTAVAFVSDRSNWCAYATFGFDMLDKEKHPDGGRWVWSTPPPAGVNCFIGHEENGLTNATNLVGRHYVLVQIGADDTSAIGVLDEFLANQGTLRVRMVIDDGVETIAHREAVKERLGELAWRIKKDPGDSYRYQPLSSPRITLIGVTLRGARGDSVICLPAPPSPRRHEFPKKMLNKIVGRK